MENAGPDPVRTPKKKAWKKACLTNGESVLSGSLG